VTTTAAAAGTRRHTGTYPTDKRFGVWRVAEDDPDSDLYPESSDADTVIGYIVAHAGGRKIVQSRSLSRISSSPRRMSAQTWRRNVRRATGLTR
jgi:hypothetical protein